MTSSAQTRSGIILPGGLYTAPASVPSPATLSVTVIHVVKQTRKSLKNRILKAVRDALEVLGALEVLLLRLFAFVALMYLLYRTIR